MPRSRAPAKPDTTRTAGISSKAVLKATGRSWDQWIKTLNAAGARKLDHPAIAELLATRFGVRPWWSQMVTVGYEQAVLGRAKHSKGSTFEISGSKTVAVPIAALFKAWHDSRSRARWLPAEIIIRKATVNKSMRIGWTEDDTLVSVNFWPKGADKSQVQVGHAKLKSPAAANKMKKHWSARLTALKAMLEA